MTVTTNKKYTVAITGSGKLKGTKKWRYEVSYDKQEDADKAISKIYRLIADNYVLSATFTMIKRNDDADSTTFYFDGVELTEQLIPHELLNIFTITKAKQIGRIVRLKAPRALDKMVRVLKGYLENSYYRHAYVYRIQDETIVTFYFSNYPEVIDLRGGGFINIYPAGNVTTTNRLTRDKQLTTVTVFELTSITKLVNIETVLHERISEYDRLIKVPAKVNDTTVEDGVDENIHFLAPDVIHKVHKDNSYGLRLITHTSINTELPYALVKYKDESYFIHGGLVRDHLNQNVNYFNTHDISFTDVYATSVNMLNDHVIHHGTGIFLTEDKGNHLINIVSILVDGKLFNGHPETI